MSTHNFSLNWPTSAAPYFELATSAAASYFGRSAARRVPMRFLSQDDARAFAERWLPAWSGNNPEWLASFYAEDVFYLDPGVPQGVEGKPALLTYFKKLLGYNPDWVWSHIEGIPLEDGFLNKWHARIPVGPKTLEVVGVCLVQLDSAGKIRRNEVYFDRSELVAEIARQRAT